MLNEDFWSGYSVVTGTVVERQFCFCHFCRMWPLCHSSVVGPNPAGGFTILRTSFVFHFAKILHFAFCQIVQSHFGLILKNVEFALCINAMDGHDQRTNLEVQMQRPFTPGFAQQGSLEKRSEPPPQHRQAPPFKRKRGRPTWGWFISPLASNLRPWGNRVTLLTTELSPLIARDLSVLFRRWIFQAWGRKKNKLAIRLLSSISRFAFLRKIFLCCIVRNTCISHCRKSAILQLQQIFHFAFSNKHAFFENSTCGIWENLHFAFPEIFAFCICEYSTFALRQTLHTAFSGEANSFRSKIKMIGSSMGSD